jgi:hypothetical protein
VNRRPVQDAAAPPAADPGPGPAVPLVAPPTAPPAGPPDSTFHMRLGYGLAAVLFAAYVALLLRRVASVRRSR